MNYTSITAKLHGHVLSDYITFIFTAKTCKATTKSIQKGFLKYRNEVCFAHRHYFNLKNHCSHVDDVLTLVNFSLAKALINS